jgi:multicomponent Na+:H+ antiporter subunit C
VTFLFAIAVVWLLVAGLVGVALSRNAIHLVGCVAIAKSSTAVLFAAIGYRHGASAPIQQEPGEPVVDPVVQAILLVDVVVGATVIALLLALAIQVRRRTGSLDPRDFVPSGWHGRSTASGEAGTDPGGA